MDMVVSFGDWLRQRRKLLDFTQEALAEKVGCSLSAIRKIESDLRKPSRQVAELLANALLIPDGNRADFIRMARGDWQTERLAHLLLVGQASNEPRPESSNFSLPQPATPLIGRGPEVNQLKRLLDSSQCRLLTLMGPGGIGKTRLAIEVAQSVQQSFPDGVFYVPLASIASPDLIATAIGQALGAAFFGSEEPENQLLSFLQQKKALLVLDNYEHLIQGTKLVNLILNRALQVKILVTSQQRLNLQGEWAFELSGLPLPPAVSGESSEEFSSVRLFLESAQRIHPGFVLSEKDHGWVNKICRLTEGFPLAIELAASWVRLLSCEEIATEIERSSDFLSATRADLPDRHQSMRSVFDRTWELMLPDDRMVFAKLSIFRGGFRREAAEHVAGARLTILSRLIDQSLLHRSSERRYEIHEILRQFAMEKLKQDANLFVESRSRHAAFYSAWMTSMEEQIRGQDQLQILEEINDEIDNIRIAWDWAISHSMYAEIQQVIPSLSAFYEMRGWYQEGAAAFQRAVDLFCVGRPGECMSENAEQFGDHTIALGRLLTYLGFLRIRSGEIEQAREMFMQALGWIGPIRHYLALADALRGLALVSFYKSRLSDALEFYEESLAAGKRIGYEWNDGFCLVSIGYIEFLNGRFEKAEEAYRQAIQIMRRIGDVRGLGLSISYLGELSIHFYKNQEAIVLLREALQYSRMTNDPYVKGIVRQRLGVAVSFVQAYREAENLLNESIQLFDQIGDRKNQAMTKCLSGFVFLFQNKSAAAQKLFQESLVWSEETKDPRVSVNALIGTAVINRQMRELDTAKEIETYLCDHPEAINVLKVFPWRNHDRVRLVLEDLFQSEETCDVKLRDWIRSLMQNSQTLEPTSA